MKKNTHLQSAKDRKDDEFYTMFDDIEKELGSYDWSNKIIGCPADSEESEFVRFFKARAKAVIYWQEIFDEEKYKETKDFYRDLSTKMFWLSLYYLQKSDFENAQMYYDKIENISEFHTYISFLDGIKFYKSGNVNAAKEKMNYVYTDLHQPVLKQIADEIISQ